MCYSSAGMCEGNHLVIQSYVDHDHFSNHADPAGATGIVGVHTTSEPHLWIIRYKIDTTLTHMCMAKTNSRSNCNNE